MARHIISTVNRLKLSSVLMEKTTHTTPHHTIVSLNTATHIRYIWSNDYNTRIGNSASPSRGDCGVHRVIQQTGEER